MAEVKIEIESQVGEVAAQTGTFLRSRYSLWILSGISFLESALPVPIITDPFLVAYILANKRSVIKGVLFTSIASVIGGLFSYALAFAFYEIIVSQYLTGPLGEQFLAIVDEFNRGTFLITLAGAVTPVPYTLVALGAGFVSANPLTFIFASLVGRGGRYLVVGILTYYVGERAWFLMKKHIWTFSAVFLIGLIIYFIFFS